MTPMRSFLVRVLITCIVLMPFPARAGLLPTGSVIAPETIGDRERIQSFVKRADVQQQLQSFGIDPKQAKARVDALTDEEIQRIAGRLATLPAGAEIAPYVWGLMIGVVIALIIVYWK